MLEMEEHLRSFRAETEARWVVERVISNGSRVLYDNYLRSKVSSVSLLWRGRGAYNSIDS